MKNCVDKLAGEARRVATAVALAALLSLSQQPARADGGATVVIILGAACVFIVCPIINAQAAQAARDRARHYWYEDAFGVVMPRARIVTGLSQAEARQKGGIVVPPNRSISVARTSGLHAAVYGEQRFVGVEMTLGQSRASAINACEERTSLAGCEVVRSESTKHGSPP